jgi:hypothetical protein
MKKLFATIALIGLNASLLLAQDSYNLSAILENQNLTFDEVSISPDQSTFAGISNESASLFIAQKKYGDYNLPTTIDTKLTEGAFRPIGFNENEYLYFTVYDVSNLVLPKYVVTYKFVGNGGFNQIFSFKRSKTIGNKNFQKKNRATNIMFYSKRKYIRPYHRLYNDKVDAYSAFQFKDIAKELIVFTEANSLVCFTQNANHVLRLNLDGTIISTKEINFKGPLVYSDKGRTVLRDEITNKYYFTVETNFSYNWYEVNPTTGATQFLLKMDDVWQNPNWKIEDGVLSYDKVVAGKMERKTVKF